MGRRPGREKHSENGEGICGGDQKLQWRAKELGLSIREIITLASLIEKETSLREERFLISSVFHNRLKRNMKMGCDPTVIYALKRDNITGGNWVGMN